MQRHTVQQLDSGPRAGAFVYTGGNDRIGRYVECCTDAWLEIIRTPVSDRGASPAWSRIGHDTADEAYAHMREHLLERLTIDGRHADWSGCTAPVGDGICDVPTKRFAAIRPSYFRRPLCDEHRTRETVEAMWDGPGDWSGSW
ncbi:hypothetical protein [Streptomyces sp. NPDC088794]|uniref:hypothetical protein n=1 Tax=Streptomyces sp. NPDC088794 TaxID=3365902 RepID=UPI0037F1F4B3